MDLQTKCRCGTEFEIEKSKRAAFCPKCDRAPVNPADEMNQSGKQLEDYSKAMDKLFKLFDKIFEPVVPCQGGCGKSYPEEIMHSGIWCSECYEIKKETN